MSCAADAACNPHHFFMPLVEAFAHAHTLLGGGMIGLAVLEAAIWLCLYVAAVNVLVLFVSPLVSRWCAGIGTYLLTGMLTLGLTFYAITPAMNLFGVAYLTLIWPFWIWGHVGVPDWIAPYLFNFA